MADGRSGGQAVDSAWKPTDGVLAGADRLAKDLEEAVHIRTAGRAPWTPPVVSCSAGRAQHVEAVVEAAERHREFLAQGRLEPERRRKRAAQVERVVSERLADAIWEERGYRAAVEALLDGERTPYDVASRVLASLVERIGPVDATTLERTP